VTYFRHDICVTYLFWGTIDLFRFSTKSVVPKQFLSRSRGLFGLKRDDDILRYCRLKKKIIINWLKISRGNLLGSCEENQTFNKLFKGRANKLIKMLTLEGKNNFIHSEQQPLFRKTTIRIVLKPFFLCWRCLFTSSFSFAHAYHAITIRA